MIAVRGKFESYTNNEGIFFHAAETGNPSDAPSFSVTYEWGTGTPPAAVSLAAPAESLAVWNKTGDNLSGNTQPSLNWSQPATGDDILFELATDEDFRLREMRVDTRVDNDFSPTDGTLAMTGTKTLEVGNMYFWSMATVDSDDHYGEWVSSSFLVSSAESTWLGGDRYEFRMKHGNGSQDNQYPACMDTYIDSAIFRMEIMLTIFMSNYVWILFVYPFMIKQVVYSLRNADYNTSTLIHKNRRQKNLLSMKEREMKLMQSSWKINIEDIECLEMIGEGAFCKVYRALMNKTWIVALKHYSYSLSLMP